MELEIPLTKEEARSNAKNSGSKSPRHQRRSMSSVNNVAQYPLHIKLVVKDGVALRGDKSGVVTTDKLNPSESDRKQTFIYEFVEDSPDNFMLKSAKTGQYLGCVGRQGQKLLHLFDFTFNRSRELMWRRDESSSSKGWFKLFHVATGKYIGGISKKPKTLGCVLVVDSAQCVELREEKVKNYWSFNSNKKAITYQTNGSLLMHHKGVFSWSPYFEFVAVDDDIRQRFYLKAARPANEEHLYLNVTSEGKVKMGKKPVKFALVPTLKSSHFFVRESENKRLLRVQEGAITTTEALSNAETFKIEDVKDVKFSGTRSIAPISPNWFRLCELLEKIAKVPIAHPVYAHFPSVFEREMSYFASVYFIAKCNDEKAVSKFTDQLKLESREKTLLSNVEASCSMVPVIMSKDTPLFKALDKACASAKQAVSESHKLFSKFAGLDMPHVSNIMQEADDTFIRVALVGDFGSGKPKALTMLKTLFKTEETRPNIFIHLGDVYKKGSRREQNENLITPLVNSITSGGDPVRVYAIPGNHDYLHKGGDGYFWGLTELQRLELTKQNASFFCLNIGQNYSIIGLDTGLGSLKLESDSLEVKINEEQRIWLKQRMEECISENRSVVVLTHHPVLSSGKKAYGTFNEQLWNDLAPYFDHIKAWFWGHEHSFRLYEPYTFKGATLQKGRLIGHGAKWKKAKNNQLPYIETPHPQAREIGVALLEISEDKCEVRYMELEGENDDTHMIENFRETL